MLLLAQHVTNGTVTGFNIAPPFTPASVTTNLGSHVAMVLGPANKQLPFPAASFDYVISLNVMEHVADMKLYLTEAQRVLRVWWWWNIWVVPLYYVQPTNYAHNQHPMFTAWWCIVSQLVPCMDRPPWPSYTPGHGEGMGGQAWVQHINRVPQ